MRCHPACRSTSTPAIACRSPRRPGAGPLIAVPALEAANLALHAAMIEAKISKVELARQLGKGEREIRRLRDTLHRSQICEVETALRLLGKRVKVSVMASVKFSGR